MICTDVEHRYIQLQEEYIKDEQRYAYWILLFNIGSVANYRRLMQELEEGTGSGTRRDQAHTECAIGHRTVYGGNRSKVCLSVSGTLVEMVILLTHP